jgi:hypothetical protein
MPSSSKWSAVGRLLKNNVCAYDILAVLYVLLAVVLSASGVFKLDFSILIPSRYDAVFLELAALYVALDAAAIFAWIRRRPSRTVSARRLHARIFLARYASIGQLIRLFKVLIWLKLVLFTYCEIKQAIPSMNPNLYDAELMVIDRFLFFGYDAFDLAVKVFSNPVSSLAMDTLYVLWYILKPCVLVYFAVLPARREHIHKRFFLVYFALWIFGGLLAVAFPSMGPVFIYPETFQNMLKPHASHLQATLEGHYFQALMNPENYKVFVYEGIAAFPSLHVGVVAVFAFFFQETSKPMGYAMFLYLLIVECGSVALGWHYAVDGIFATLLAYLFYRISSRIVPNPLPGAHGVPSSKDEGKEGANPA